MSTAIIVLRERRSASATALTRACSSSSKRRLICFMAPEYGYTGAMSNRVIARSAGSLAAETAFRTRLQELGAALLEPEWLGAQTPHRVQCRAGHSCRPRPADVRKGHGVCGLCGGNARGSGPTLFRERLTKVGATLVEPNWHGSNAPHSVICANGHMCRPTPANVSQGHGVCLRCRSLSWTAFYVLTHRSEPRVKFGITNRTDSSAST